MKHEFEPIIRPHFEDHIHCDICGEHVYNCKKDNGYIIVPEKIEDDIQEEKTKRKLFRDEYHREDEEEMKQCMDEDYFFKWRGIFF
jgi:hypothetical protein